MKALYLTILSTILFTALASAQEITDGLICYYPLNGTAEDLSGNDLHGTISGAEAVPDRFNTPLSAMWDRALTEDEILQFCSGNPLAVEDDAQQIEYSAVLYPNPSLPSFRISVKGLENDLFRVVLREQSGRFVKDVNVRSGVDSIDTSDLAQGTYIATILHSDSEFSDTVIFIKQ